MVAPDRPGRKIWPVRTWKQEEESDLLELLGLCFDDEKVYSGAFLDWAVRNPPGGPGTVLVATSEETGRIVGEMWVTTYMVRVDGRELSCYQGMNLGVHPGFRLRGIWRALMAASFRLGKSGFPLAMAYGNPGNYGKVAPQLGYHVLDNVDLLICVLRPGQMAGKLPIHPLFRGVLSPFVHVFSRMLFPSAKKETDTAGLEYAETDRFDGRFDLFWNRVRDKYPCMRVRDSRHQNWRFAECPGRDYRIMTLNEGGDITACMVTRLVSDFGLPMTVIVDVLAEPGQQGRRAVALLARRVMRQALEEGHAAVLALMIPRGEEYSAIREAGFRRVPTRLRPRDVFLLVRADDPTVRDTYYDPRNWHSTFSDADFG